MAFFASLRRFKFYTDHSTRIKHNNDQDHSFVFVYHQETRRIPSRLKIATVAPDVEEIPKKTFFKKQQLSRVDFSQANQLGSIGEAAFANCKNLIEIHFPYSVESIRAEAFSHCTKLRRVRLNAKLVSIGHSAFLNCRELQSMDFTRANHLQVIGAHALSYCSSLTTIEISASIKEIQHSAFLACEGLKEARFRNSYIMDVPQRAFEMCPNLRLVDFGSATKISTIQISAFESCTSLEVVRLPLRLQILEERAFFNCLRLNEVIFPASLTKIKAMAFGNCEQLKTVTLPSSLNSLENAFDGRYLEKIGVSGENLALCIRLCRLYPEVLSFEHISSIALKYPETLVSADFLMPALSEDELQLETDLLAALRLEHVNAIWRLVTWGLARGIMLQH